MSEATTIADVLGGAACEVTNALDLIDVARQGVTKKELSKLASRLGRKPADMAALLPIGRRTIQRYKEEDHFHQDVSESILQLAEVVARGIDVFGDEQKFRQWLEYPSRPLAGRTPLSVLDSRFGMELVLHELGRIEHGIIG
jgi:putative toxin-antitoxin system antitoxin component (TIGR02293 family)